MATFSDPDRLDDLMLRDGADIRSPLLWTLVDLYLQKPTHTADETQHFTELTLRLLDEADAETLNAMARHLGSYPSVPALIAERLAIDIPGTATASTAPAPQRVSPVELTDLFFDASSAERRLILTNLAYVPGLAAIFTGDVREAARHLETAALAHNPDAFMRALERWLGIAPSLARSIVSDVRGEPIVVAAKALDIPPDAMQRILLFLNPAVGRSVSRVHELARLFDTIDSDAARTLAAIWRAAGPRTTAKLTQPEPTERGPRRTATPRAFAMQRDGASVRVAGSQR